MSCLYPIPAHDAHGQKAKPLPKESAVLRYSTGLPSEACKQCFIFIRKDKEGQNNVINTLLNIIKRKTPLTADSPVRTSPSPKKPCGH